MVPKSAKLQSVYFYVPMAFLSSPSHVRRVLIIFKCPASSVLSVSRSSGLSEGWKLASHAISSSSIELMSTVNCFCSYSKMERFFLFITDRVRSTRERYVLTRVCPSVCLFTPGGGAPWPGPARGVPQPGGYPSQVRGGVPHLGYPLPPSDLAGGVPHPR